MIQNQKNIVFGSRSEEILKDSLKLLVISVVTYGLYFLMLLPVLPMRRFGFIYGGFMSSLLTMILIVVIVIIIFRNFIIAYIAKKDRTAKETLAGLFQLFRVENINLIIYSFFNSVIPASVFLFLLIIVTSASLFTNSAVSVLSLSSYNKRPEFSLYSVDRFLSMISARNQAGELTAEGTGFFLMAITFGLLFLIITAYVINLVQSFAVVSIHIMESNPGRSVNRNTVLGFILLFIGIAVFAILR